MYLAKKTQRIITMQERTTHWLKILSMDMDRPFRAWVGNRWPFSFGETIYVMMNLSLGTIAVVVRICNASWDL